MKYCTPSFGSLLIIIILLGTSVALPRSTMCTFSSRLLPAGPLGKWSGASHNGTAAGSCLIELGPGLVAIASNDAVAVSGWSTSRPTDATSVLFLEVSFTVADDTILYPFGVAFRLMMQRSTANVPSVYTVRTSDDRFTSDGSIVHLYAPVGVREPVLIHLPPYTRAFPTLRFRLYQREAAVAASPADALILSDPPVGHPPGTETQLGVSTSTDTMTVDAWLLHLEDPAVCGCRHGEPVAFGAHAMSSLRAATRRVLHSPPDQYPVLTTTPLGQHSSIVAPSDPEAVTGPEAVGWMDVLCHCDCRPPPPPLPVGGTFPLLSPAAVPTVAPAELTNLPPWHVPVASLVQVPALAPEQVPLLGPAQVPVVAPEHVPAVSPSQAPALAPSQVPVVAPEQVPLLGPAQVPVVAPEHVPAVSPSQAPALAPSQVPVVAPEQVPLLGPAQVPVVAPEHVPAVSPSQAPALSPVLVPLLSPSDHPACAAVPVVTCMTLLEDGYTTSGVYTVDPDGGGGRAPFQAYCEQTLGGGGWMLMFNRRAGTDNVEACGSTTHEFMNMECGDVTAVGAGDSYAIGQDARLAYPHTELMMVQSLAGVVDCDDAMIVGYPAGTDLWPNTTGLVHIPLDYVCDLSGSTCDFDNVTWKYAGDSWFHNARCLSNYSGEFGHRGDYGVCHDGAFAVGNSIGPFAGSFTGDRQWYDFVKLWDYRAMQAKDHQERLFHRVGGPPSVVCTLPDEWSGSGRYVFCSQECDDGNCTLGQLTRGVACALGYAGNASVSGASCAGRFFEGLEGGCW
eukprot:TRINITY_DN590_c0_g1_i4.p1 TRINITY_DN590_c0_g1~~TRINITY_DN590_c0_g1_i4.p1  ORF type:complete len:830 (-),score=143.32 TRINITY_DN590_c0_g1_i4:352-2718(-)